MKLLIRLWHVMMPRFRCTLTTCHDYERVVGKLGKNIDSALLPSPVNPFYGNLDPPRFTVELTGEDERPRTHLSGTLECGRDHTRINIEAGPGWLGIAIPLIGMGIMAAASLGFGLDRFDLAASWFLGTLVVVFVFRYIELRSFWHDVNGILDTLEYILAADIAARSHDVSGSPLDGPSPFPADTLP